MKRFLTYFAVMVASATVLVGCFGGDNYTSAVPEDAFSVLRFDANQVLEKSGSKQEALDAFRAELQKENMPDFMLAIADDLRNTGVDIEAPMYAFAQMVDHNTIFVACVAKTYSTSLLEKVIDRISEGSVKPKKVENGILVQDKYEPSMALGYNDDAVIFGCVAPIKGYNECNAKPFVEKALKAAQKGDGNDDILPTYEDRDMALCIHAAPFVDILKQAMQSNYSADLARAVAELESARESRFDFAFNFAKGSIDLEMLATNWPKKVAYEPETSSHQNLKYVSANALAVANLPFDGEQFVRAFDKFLTENPDVKRALDEELNRSTNGAMNTTMLMTIAGPFVSSIKGDVTVALNDLKQETVWDPYYNYYDGGYRNKILPNACVVVPVKNNKIMDMASAYLAFAPEVNRVSQNLYTTEIEKGMPAFFGQKDGVLFGSTPNNFEVADTPATEASWYDEVDNSYAYAVVNIDALFKNAVVSTELNKEIYNEFGAMGYHVMQTLDLFNYFVVTTPTLESSNIRLVLKNDNENSLKQITDKIKVAVLQQAY